MNAVSLVIALRSLNGEEAREWQGALDSFASRVLAGNRFSQSQGLKPLPPVSFSGILEVKAPQIGYTL